MYSININILILYYYMEFNTVSVVDKPGQSTPSVPTTSKNCTVHKLNSKWTLWAHLPHDTDWSIKSYKKLYTFGTIEEALALYHTIPDKLIVNCMLFLMRDGIKPMWEDKKNRDGGCFSYKIANKTVLSIWENLSYMLIGESLSQDLSVLKTINGITISPKKHFCIIKLWFSTCKFQNPEVISTACGLQTTGCLFKKHKPVN